MSEIENLTKEGIISPKNLRLFGIEQFKAKKQKELRSKIAKRNSSIPTNLKMKGVIDQEVIIDNHRRKN